MRRPCPLSTHKEKPAAGRRWQRARFEMRRGRRCTASSVGIASGRNRWPTTGSYRLTQILQCTIFVSRMRRRYLGRASGGSAQSGNGNMDRLDMARYGVKRFQQIRLWFGEIAPPRPFLCDFSWNRGCDSTVPYTHRHQQAQPVSPWHWGGPVCPAFRKRPATSARAQQPAIRALQKQSQHPSRFSGIRP